VVRLSLRFMELASFLRLCFSRGVSRGVTQVKCSPTPRRAPIDRARGILICPIAEAFTMGTRSPYASLPAVGRPSASASFRARENGVWHVLLPERPPIQGPYEDARDRGRNWRPLRRALVPRLIDAVARFWGGGEKGRRP
jgi:hypothetical protein